MSLDQDLFKTPLSPEMEGRFAAREAVVIKEKEKFLVVYDNGKVVYWRVFNSEKESDTLTHTLHDGSQGNTKINFHLRTGEWEGVTSEGHGTRGHLVSYKPMDNDNIYFPDDFAEELSTLLSLLEKNGVAFPDKPTGYPEIQPLTSLAESYGTVAHKESIIGLTLQTVGSAISPLLGLDPSWYLKARRKWKRFFKEGPHKVYAFPVGEMKTDVPRIMNVSKEYQGRVALFETNYEGHTSVHLFSPAEYFQAVKECTVSPEEAQGLLQKYPDLQPHGYVFIEGDKIERVCSTQGMMKFPRYHDMYRCSSVHFPEEKETAFLFGSGRLSHTEISEVVQLHVRNENIRLGLGMLQENDPRLLLPVSDELWERLKQAVDIPHCRRDYLALYKCAPEGVQRKKEFALEF